MRKIHLPLLLFSTVGIAAPVMDTVRLDVDGHSVVAEVARTKAQLETGLMYRKSLPNGKGMLFNFPFPGGYCMWMENTYVPLSVAFIAPDGRIINIEDMAPLTTNLHCSKGMALYALEVPQGWFAKNKIAAGAAISGLKH